LHYLSLSDESHSNTRCKTCMLIGQWTWCIVVLRNLAKLDIEPYSSGKNGTKVKDLVIVYSGQRASFEAASIGTFT